MVLAPSSRFDDCLLNVDVCREGNEAPEGDAHERVAKLEFGVPNQGSAGESLESIHGWCGLVDAIPDVRLGRILPYAAGRSEPEGDVHPIPDLPPPDN